MTKMLSLLTISTLLLTSCSGPESSGGVTLSKTEGSSVRGARPNTNHGWSGNHSADRNAQQAAKLKITSPNGGEKWAVGSVQNVEWEKDSKGPHVIIRVYKSKKYVETITRKTKNDGSHSWKLPSSFKTGATFSIKVTSFTYHNACATYADYLTYSPGHGRALVSDKTDTSHYMCTDSSGGAAAKDSCWNSCVSKYGSKNCEVVDVDGNKCTSTASAYDSSDSNFTITKSGGGGSSLKVSTPNGGESWTTGKTQSIKWSKGNAGANVKIELLKSGKKSLTISKKTKNDGKHSWKIPATVATASTYKIKITSSTKKTVSDSSDSNFTITKSGGGGSSLKVSTPNGGESWTTGKTQSIKWSKGNAGANVKIELLKSGKKSLTISKKTKNDGKHSWKIPATVATASTYKIKITSSTKKTVSDSSDSNFTITKSGGGGSSLKVSTPNGGESWTTGKTQSIKWSKGNAGANVKIELLKSGKKSLTISKKTKNDGKHSWKIPATVATASTYKIKITSSTKKTVSDSSDSNFTITKSGGGGSSLKVSTPNGGESWTTGKTQSIKWSKGNAGANVKIELLKSGKKSLTISKKTKNDGKHSWKIPATVATASTYKIKITSSTKKTVSDSSDSNFTITKAAADTCTMKVRVGDSSVTTYHPGKKVCLGKTSTDVVCGTTGGAGPNYWATIKKVPKKSLNIYPCGSKNKYPAHGVDASYCGGTFEIHPWGFGNDYEAKCGF